MIDRAEATRRGQKPPKTSTKPPYAAIEHRVLDSLAFADLSFSAKTLLMLMARQITGDKKGPANNGHLQASFKWCSKYGFGSEHTLRAAIAELIGHGFIYRTRSHGANGAWARYALTWLPIRQTEGLFLGGYVACAWRRWDEDHKKSSPQKLPDQSSRKCSFTPKLPAESAGIRGAKTADYELVASRGVVTAVTSLPPSTKESKRRRPEYQSSFAIRQSVTADRPSIRIH